MSKRKIAIICSRFPFPLNKGDKLRLFHQIRYLSNHFSIDLHAIDEENVLENNLEELRKYCTEIYLYPLNYLQKSIGVITSIFRNEPIQLGYFYSKKNIKLFQQRIKENNYDGIYAQLARVYPYLKEIELPIVFDYQDCFSKNYLRLYPTKSFFKKLFYQREYEKMKILEEKIYSSLTFTCIISEADKIAMSFEASNIQVISNGVDFSFYAPQQLEKKYDILFSGNLNYEPNELAVLFILQNLLPPLVQKIPDIKIGIAGNTNNTFIQNFSHPNVFVENQVNDMRNAYAKTKIFIAPLFAGAGLQNKLLEAMAMQIPCICTEICNASLKAEEDKEIILANDINTFIEKISFLLLNEKERDALALNGRNFILNNYGWDRQNEKLKSLLELAIFYNSMSFNKS